MKIKDLPKVDRPREKLEKYGAGKLSNSELLAILLRTGSKGVNVVELSNSILKKFGNGALASASVEELKDVHGLGAAKACEIVKEKFIEQFFDARENINKVKREFGDAVTVHFILRQARDGDERFGLEKEEYNIASIDNILKNLYHQGLIRAYTKHDLQRLISGV